MKLIKEYTEYNELDVISEANTEGGRTYRITGPFLQAEVKNRNGRVYGKPLMEREVNLYNTEKISHNRALGELDHPSCNLDTKFDVLTLDGWKSFKKLCVGEKIYTLNEEGIIELQPIQRLINEPYKGHGYHIKGRQINSSFTPTHRMLLLDRYGKYQYATIEEIYNNRTKFSHHKIAKLGEFVGKDIKNIVIQGIDDSEYNNKFKLDVRENLVIDTMTFVKFLGIWLADGHVSKTGKYSFGISQNDGWTCERIEEVLDDMPLEFKKYTITVEETGVVKHKYICHDIRLHRYLIEMGDCYTKYIPHEIKQLSSIYLEELFYWFALGDGRFHTKKEEERNIDNVRNVFSVSKRLVEDLHECLIKSGYSGNWTEYDTTDDYMFSGHLIEANNKSTLYQLNKSTTTGVYVDKRMLDITKVEHDGLVHCLTVKNSNFYMKENGKGYWTGNSPSINLDRVSHIIETLQMTGNDGMGVAKILKSTPCGLIAHGLLSEGIKLGVSTRGIGTITGNKVNDDFKLLAVDIVADPSAPSAFVEGILENKEYMINNNNIVEVAVHNLQTTMDKNGSSVARIGMFEFLEELRKNL